MCWDKASTFCFKAAACSCVIQRAGQGASPINWHLQLIWFKYSRKFFSPSSSGSVFVYFFRFILFTYLLASLLMDSFIYSFLRFQWFLFSFLLSYFRVLAARQVWKIETYFYVKWNGVCIFDYWIVHDCSLLSKLLVKLVLEYVDERWVLFATGDKWRRNAAEIVALTRPLAEDKALRDRVLEKGINCSLIWFDLCLCENAGSL